MLRRTSVPNSLYELLQFAGVINEDSIKQKAIAFYLSRKCTGSLGHNSSALALWQLNLRESDYHCLLSH